MSGPTFEDMMNDPFGREIVRIFEERMGGQLNDETKAWLVDSTQGSVVRVRQKQSWTRTTATIARNIVSGTAHPAEFPLFWIRLYSIVFELYPSLDRHREVIEAVPSEAPELEAIDAMMADLTEDDRAFIRFMRTSHAHMYVDYVRHSAKKTEQGDYVVRMPSDRRVEELARRVIAWHGDSQQRVAVSYAEKLVNHLERLADAAEDPEA